MNKSILLAVIALILLPLASMAKSDAEATLSTEFEATLQVAQSSFNNWASGGENTFSGRGTLRYRNLWKKDKLTVDFNSSARYGMNVIEGDAFKNEDEFILNLLTTWDMPKGNWAYAGSAIIRSQFTNGYTSRDDDTLLSKFFAPGYIDLSVGFSYKKKDSPFTLVLSPAAGSITVVGSETLSEQGVYGVTPGKHVFAEIGASLDARFDKKFGKDMFRYRSSLLVFKSYSDSMPNVQWDNTLDINPLKWLAISLTGRIYYDEYANVAKPTSLQYNYGFSVGLSYLFKSK